MRPSTSRISTSRISNAAVRPRTDRAGAHIAGGRSNRLRGCHANPYGMAREGATLSHRHVHCVENTKMQIGFQLFGVQVFGFRVFPFPVANGRNVGNRS
jgi:hypothetical protein